MRTDGLSWAGIDAALGHFDLVADASLNWYDSSANVKQIFCGDCGTSLFYQLYAASVIAIALGMFNCSGGLKLVDKFMRQATRHGAMRNDTIATS